MSVLRKKSAPTNLERNVWFIAGLMAVIVYGMWITIDQFILFVPNYDAYGHRIIKLHDHVIVGVIDKD